MKSARYLEAIEITRPIWKKCFTAECVSAIVLSIALFNDYQVDQHLNYLVPELGIFLGFSILNFFVSGFTAGKEMNDYMNGRGDEN